MTLMKFWMLVQPEMLRDEAIEALRKAQVDFQQAALKSAADLDVFPKLSEHVVSHSISCTDLVCSE